MNAIASFESKRIRMLLTETLPDAVRNTGEAKNGGTSSGNTISSLDSHVDSAV